MKIKLEPWEEELAKNIRADDERKRSEYQRNKALDDVLFPIPSKDGRQMPHYRNEYNQRQTLTDWIGR